MERKGSLLHSQDPNTGSHPEPNELPGTTLNGYQWKLKYAN